jgi:hypothetical protein
MTSIMGGTPTSVCILVWDSVYFFSLQIISLFLVFSLATLSFCDSVPRQSFLGGIRVPALFP